MTANGRALRCVGIEAQKLNNPQKHHRSTMLNISTSATYSKTPVICCAFLGV